MIRKKASRNFMKIDHCFISSKCQFFWASIIKRPGLRRIFRFSSELPSDLIRPDLASLAKIKGISFDKAVDSSARRTFHALLLKLVDKLIAFCGTYETDGFDVASPAEFLTVFRYFVHDDGNPVVACINEKFEHEFGVSFAQIWYLALI
jgi:hypothetical protein